MVEIEEYNTVKIWIKKACGTETTKKVYIPRLRRFLEHYNVNPDEIVEKWKEVRYDWTQRERFLDEWSEKIEDYYALLESAPLSKVSAIIPVKSFFEHHKIPIEVETQRHVHVTYHNRDIEKSGLNYRHTIPSRNYWENNYSH